MSFSSMTLPEFDQEMATTRTCLERVPDDKYDWQPHEKSMSLARLLGHLAELPIWLTMAATTDSLDLAPPGEEPWKPYVASSREELLETFDKNVAEAREALTGVQDESLGAPWTLLSGGQELLKMPRGALIRSIVLNHLYHHRGQLTVYLRLNEISVPSIYGPSADEGQMGPG